MCGVGLPEAADPPARSLSRTGHPGEPVLLLSSPRSLVTPPELPPLRGDRWRQVGQGAGPALPPLLWTPLVGSGCGSLPSVRGAEASPALSSPWALRPTPNLTRLGAWSLHSPLLWRLLGGPGICPSRVLAVSRGKAGPFQHLDWEAQCPFQWPCRCGHFAGWAGPDCPRAGPHPTACQAGWAWRGGPGRGADC